MSLKAVLFDLDGTLADTLSDIACAMNGALASLGLARHPPTAYRGFVGEGAAALARRVLPPGRQDLLDVLVEAFRRCYGEVLLRETTPYPGILTLLASLSGRRVPMAILSNKPDALSRKIVEHLFGWCSFVSVRGALPDVPLKPDPTAALAIARALGHRPGAIALVGDSAIDMQTAVRAGMFPVGVLWGFRRRSELLANGAGALLERPGDLLELVDQPAGPC